MEKYGLTEKETELLKSAFEKFSQVETVFIYGSRAKNTFRKTSDIDLAVRFKNGNDASMAQLKSELDDLPIIHEIDLTDEAQIEAGDFKDEYERTKQIFYLKGWKTTTLGEVVEITSSKRIFADEYKKSGIPFFRGKEISEKFSGNKISTELFISEKKYYEIKNKFGVPEENDILLTSVGTLGNPYLVEKDLKFYFKDGNLTWFRNYKDIVPKFLFYWIISPQGKETLFNAKIGSTQEAYTIAKLKMLSCIIPPLPEQRAIAAVLSSLDDKIELLRDQNKTLEATAQAIFKEWFVNFNFPGTTGKMIDSAHGKIPEGWRVGKIEDLCKKLASGGTPATINKDYYGGDIDWFSTKELQDNFIFESDKKITKAGLENSSAKVFPKGSVVMAIYAAPTVGRLGILGKDATFNQAACGFVADEAIASNEYIYLLLLSLRDDFNGLANGAAQQNLNVGLVKNFAIIIPDKIIMAQFKAIIVPIFGKMLNNTSQIQTLSTLRDLLLPKLMKGKVRVKI